MPDLTSHLSHANLSITLPYWATLENLIMLSATGDLGKWEAVFTLGTEQWGSHSGRQLGRIMDVYTFDLATLLQGINPEESVSNEHGRPIQGHAALVVTGGSGEQSGQPSFKK